MAEFEPTPNGARLALDAMETQLLRQLTDELLTIVEHPERNAVHDRLFPAAFDDPDEEAKYKDLVRDDLERHKLEAFGLVKASLGKRRTDVTIEGDDFETWIQCLTDLRLAIGTGLDVDEERMSRDPNPSDPDAQAMFVLHWLGFLQQGLIEARTIAGP